MLRRFNEIDFLEAVLEVKRSKVSLWGLDWLCMDLYVENLSFVYI